MLMSLKEYAETRGITYEAVRTAVKRYTEELEGHILSDPERRNARMLDEAAVEFLDKKRAAAPLVIVNETREERINQLEEQNRALLVKVAEQAEALLQAQNQLVSLQIETAKGKLLEESIKVSEAKTAALEAQLKEKDDRIFQKDLDLQVSQIALDAKESEVQHLRQELEAVKGASLWQRIRGWR